MAIPKNVRERILLYAKNNRRKLAEQLGSGIDGEVWSTEQETAIKGLYRESNDSNERHCYLLLQDVRLIGGLNIPKYKNHDDELRVLCD